MPRKAAGSEEGCPGTPRPPKIGAPDGPGRRKVTVRPLPRTRQRRPHGGAGAGGERGGPVSAALALDLLAAAVGLALDRALWLGLDDVAVLARRRVAQR
jgi:hypothetical protein